MRKNHLSILLPEDNGHETSYSCSHLNGPCSRACASSSRARPDPLWNASHARSCSVAFTVSRTYSHSERHASTHERKGCLLTRRRYGHVLADVQGEQRL